MLGLREVLEGPQKERIVIQAEVPGEPPDIDRLGLKAELDDGSLAVGPPLDELKDRAAATRRSSRLRRRSGRRTLSALPRAHRWSPLSRPAHPITARSAGARSPRLSTCTRSRPSHPPMSTSSSASSSATGRSGTPGSA